MMRVGSLFSGIGGFDLGLERAGMEIIWQVEIDPFCNKVLAKHWPSVKRFLDVKTVGSKDLEPVDLICGGFPCQDISVAGFQEGIEACRSGLWSEFTRIIGDLRPKYAIVENVANLLNGGGGKWFGRILTDMAALRYDVQWHCIPASYVGACHRRDRVWIIAYPIGSNVEGMDVQKSLCSYPQESCGREFTRAINETLSADDYARMRGDYDGVPEIMERLKAIGNSVFPAIPEIIGRAIMEIESAD